MLQREATPESARLKRYCTDLAAPATRCNCVQHSGRCGIIAVCTAFSALRSRLSLKSSIAARAHWGNLHRKAANIGCDLPDRTTQHHSCDFRGLHYRRKGWRTSGRASLSRDTYIDVCSTKIQVRKDSLPVYYYYTRRIQYIEALQTGRYVYH